jgi:prepilin peptidase CpaA
MNPSLYIPTLFLALLPTCLLWAAYKDLTSFTIPNRISLILVAAFFPTALSLGLTLQDMGSHLLVGFLFLLAGIGLFALKLYGGGDAKLMAAASLWLGMDAWLGFVVYTTFCGGLMAILFIVARKMVFHQGWKKPLWVEKLLEDKGGIPYGIAIGAGAILSMSRSQMGEKWLSLAGL